MKKVILIKDKANQRIDKFLKKEVFFNDEKITRGEIIRQIKSENILINGKKIKPSYVLKEGDVLEINLEKKPEEIMPNKDIKIEVIHKDKNFIIINKPAGISVHPSDFKEKDTLANWIALKFPEIKNVGDDLLRPGIVHRLDKDTSGAMVIARNQETFKELKKLFKDRKVEKKYLALVFGKMEKKEGSIEKPIARAKNYKKQVIAGKKTRTKIREALTKYKVVREYEKCSLVEVSPKTGRMHQIRVHMFSIGHPIVGDKVYRLKSVEAKLLSGRRTFDIAAGFSKRHLLHARSLKFSLFGKEYGFEAETPFDFRQFIERVDESGIKR